MAPVLSAEVPFRGPKLKKAALCLPNRENTVLDTLCVGMSYDAVCSELSGQESTV